MHASVSALEAFGLKVVQACQFRGSKSRNKVSVGEPAEGSNFVFYECIKLLF